MATQTETLGRFKDSIWTQAPEEMSNIMSTAYAKLDADFDRASIIKPGTVFPSSVTLSNAAGTEISLSSLFTSAEKGVLITFYRGEWCPYCNVVLPFLQKYFEDFKARGVTLVAISPELPSFALTMTEKHALKYEVLSDKGNTPARQLGLVWKQSASLIEVRKQIGVDFAARNGDSSGEIPVATNILVDKNGVVRNVHADTDSVKRLEPSILLEWVDAL